MRALQWLVPAGAVLSRICRGYADVKVFLPDVERLARADRLRASWIPLLCGDSGREASETARTLAKSYFDEPRWPLKHALAWIACRQIEALTLRPEELRSLLSSAVLYKDDTSGLVSKNPAHELLTALKRDKLEAIGPDNKELPPEFWDGKSEYWTWPEVRFRREDMFRLWPASEAMPKDEASCEGSPSSEASASDVPAESGELPPRIEACGKDRGSDENPPPSAGDLPAPARARAPSLSKRLAAELSRMYPGGRPAKSVEELRRDLEKRSEVGSFRQRTLAKASDQTRLAVRFSFASPSPVSA
jgi:hypothetical protein